MLFAEPGADPERCRTAKVVPCVASAFEAQHYNRLPRGCAKAVGRW